MAVNPVYIDTEEKLIEALEEINEYTGDSKWHLRKHKPILALDLETYHLHQTDEEGNPTEGVPRPILQADGTYSGQIRLIQIGLNPAYDPKYPQNNTQFIVDVKILGYSLCAKYLKDVLERI